QSPETVRTGGDTIVPNAGRTGRAAGQRPIFVRQSDDRNGLATVRDADPLRRGLSRPLQMQHPPDRRLPKSLAVSTRSLSARRRRGDGEFRSHQAPLLHDARRHQSDTDRAHWAVTRSDRAAWTRREIQQLALSVNADKRAPRRSLGAEVAHETVLRPDLDVT